MIANGEHESDAQGMRCRWRMLACPPVALPGLFHGQACRLLFLQASTPLFDPALPVAQGGSELGVGPFGMASQQIRQIGTSGGIGRGHDGLSFRCERELLERSIPSWFA